MSWWLFVLGDMGENRSERTLQAASLETAPLSVRDDDARVKDSSHFILSNYLIPTLFRGPSE